MRVSFVSTMLAVGALAAMPVAAVAQPAANPASSLSVSHAVRASSATSHHSDLAGAGLFAAVIAAGIVAIVVIGAVNNSDNSDSN